MSSKQLVLLTACVNPNGMAYTVLQDCEERYYQYMEALDFYLRNTNTPIVFVENSNYDLSSMKEQFDSCIQKGRLEILSFNGNDYDRSLGKGFGEALILRYALDHSKFIKHVDVVIKITGRLQCTNIELIQRLCKLNNLVTANVVYDQWGNLECHSHIFSAPPRFLSDYFLPESDKLDDSKNYWFEHLLLDSVKRWKRDGGEFREFPVLPVMVGKRGSVGVKYNIGLREKISYLFRYWKHKKLINSL